MQIATPTKNNKWRIPSGLTYRYFTQKQIDSCQLRKMIEQTPMGKKNLRNNVEASIFQVCLNTRNNKTKYRGKIKQKMWATLRCLWINLVRIKNFIRKLYLNYEISKNSVSLSTILVKLYAESLSFFDFNPKIYKKMSYLIQGRICFKFRQVFLNFLKFTY